MPTVLGSKTFTGVPGLAAAATTAAVRGVAAAVSLDAAVVLVDMDGGRRMAGLVSVAVALKTFLGAAGTGVETVPFDGGWAMDSDDVDLPSPGGRCMRG